MAGKGKTGKQQFAKDRVERGLEADSTRPLYAADSIHSTEEAKFAFDSDRPVEGPVVSPRGPIEEADEQDSGRREPVSRLKRRPPRHNAGWGEKEAIPKANRAPLAAEGAARGGG